MSESLASLLLDPMNSSRKLSPSPSPLGTRLQVVGTGVGGAGTLMTTAGTLPNPVVKVATSLPAASSMTPMSGSTE